MFENPQKGARGAAEGRTATHREWVPPNRRNNRNKQRSTRRIRSRVRLTQPQASPEQRSGRNATEFASRIASDWLGVFAVRQTAGRSVFILYRGAICRSDNSCRSPNSPCSVMLVRLLSAPVGAVSYLAWERLTLTRSVSEEATHVLAYASG